MKGSNSASGVVVVIMTKMSTFITCQVPSNSVRQCRDIIYKNGLYGSRKNTGHDLSPMSLTLFTSEN